MAVHTIKATGGDYSTLTAWEAAAPATLTEPYEAECYDFACDDDVAIVGITTSATNYIRIYAAASAALDGRSRDVSGVGFQLFRSSGATAGILRVDANYFRVEGIEFTNKGTTGYTLSIVATRTAGANDVRVTGCIIHDVRTGTQYTCSMTASNLNLTLTNNIIYGYQRTWDTRGAASVVSNNNTIWRHADQIGVVSQTELVCKNTYSGRVSGTSECFWTGGLSPSGNNNASSDNSAATDYTSSLTTVAGAVIFQSVTPGAEDFRLVSGAALIDAGATLTVANDIAGTTRPSGAAWDIGAWEFVGATAITGTGDATAPAADAGGSGVLGVSGSGEADAPATEAGGDGVLGVGGAGDADASAPSADGAGVLGVTGDGAADAPAPTAQGTGTYSPPGVAGSGNASAPAATGEGDGTLGVTGQGDAIAPAATADGAGTVTAPPITGTADADAPSPEAAGDGVLGVSGDAEADAPAAVGGGTGSSSPPGVAGLGDATAPAPEASGTGKIGVTGDGDADAPSPGASGDGTLGVSGSGAASAPAADADGQGALGVTGTGSADAPMATAEGTETVPNAGPRFSAIEPPRPVTATEPARNISIVIGVLDLMNRVGAKYPWEKRLFEADFVRHIPEGVTITSCTVEVTAYSGTDPNAASMPIGSVIIDGTKCKAWIEAGLDGVDYVAAFKAIGSDSRKMESKLQFLVTEAA